MEQLFSQESEKGRKKMLNLILFCQVIVLLALPFYLLWLIFKEQEKETPSRWKQLIVLGILALYGGIAAPVSAAVRAICPWEIFNQERFFFWHIFIDLLKSTDSFAEAWKKMLLRIPEVTWHIQDIALLFKAWGLIFMIAGGITAALMFFMLFRKGEKKTAPWLLCLMVAAAFAFSVAGLHQRSFSSHIERRLKMYLSARVDFLQEWSKKDQKLFRSNREIAEFLPRYLKENPRLFGDSQARLEPGVFKEKKQTP